MSTVPAKYVRVGNKIKPASQSMFAGMYGGRADYEGAEQRRWRRMKGIQSRPGRGVNRFFWGPAKAVMERVHTIGVNLDRTINVHPSKTTPLIEYVRARCGVPQDPDGQPPRALLQWLYDQDLDFWIGGFTEVLNGLAVNTTHRGAYRSGDVVGDWVQRYTYQYRAGGTFPTVTMEYIIAWHIVVNDPKKDLLTKIDGVSKRIASTQRDIADKKSVLSTDWWLNFGAGVGEFAATEAISYLLGVGIAKKLQQAYKASTWVAKWLAKLGRTGKFVTTHSKKITDVTSAVLVAALKSKGGAGDTVAGGLGATLSGPASVVIEGLGLAAGLIDLSATEATKRIDEKVRADKRSKSTEPRDWIAVDLATMQAEMRIFVAQQKALKSLLPIAKDKLAADVAVARVY